MAENLDIPKKKINGIIDISPVKTDEEALKEKEKSLEFKEKSAEF